MMICIFSTRGESEKHIKRSKKKKILTLINYFLGFHINTAHHPRFHLLWNILICHFGATKWNQNVHGENLSRKGNGTGLERATITNHSDLILLFISPQLGELRLFDQSSAPFF